LLTTHWICKRWWTVDFSKREGYQLQPAKSVILPVKSKIKTIETNEGFWKIDNRIMPVVDKATHIGITRSDTNSARIALKVSCNNFVCHLNIFPFGITISSP
jgi:hypothetical protein